ncbi:uracil-DNA glycosylase [Paraburkholderia sp. A1RI_3L]|uniref:uracil-DNA glycosylase n=1 Tax=Paraburkholderia TaxID=1822464 RepID=UPI003B77E9D1
MTLHETVLEELGLAPLWVRRGAQDQGPAGASAESRADLPPIAVAAGDRDADVAPRAAVPAARHEAQASGVLAPAVAVSPAVARTSGSAAAVANAPTAKASGGADADTVVPPSATTAPFVDEPPPAEDDFAWFDAPSSAPVQEAPAAQDAPDAPSVSTLDWDALAARVADCHRCRLCEKRTNTVFGVGDREAEWMLVGEAPGENEDRQGEPFVGQAGKLLDNMLRALALARGNNVYIANVIKCRPPGNRNPEPDEVARCEPYLQRQVALVKPKIIVALGRFAAQSLLKTDASISSLRGRVHEYEGVPVIVTYHPAYLLRSLHDKAKAWTDLCLARDTWRKGAGGEK